MKPFFRGNTLCIARKNGAQQAEIPRCFGMMTVFSQTLPALRQQPIYSEHPWYQRLPKREQERLSPWASAR